MLDNFCVSIIRHDLACATVREPEDICVKAITAALKRDQPLLHKLLLTPAPIARRNGAYTVALVVSEKDETVSFLRLLYPLFRNRAGNTLSNFEFPRSRFLRGYLRLQFGRNECAR